MPDRLAYTFRGALSAVLALVLAWWFGLDHPQWAAMAAVASLQPTRGQLVERSFYRVVGSISGSAVGVFLLYCFGFSSLILVVALGIWLGICAAAATVQRGYVAYGVGMAGLTAVMVALLKAPVETDLFSIGVDRSLTAILGVCVMLVVCWFFTPKASKGLLEQRCRRFVTSLLRALVEVRDSSTQSEEDEGKKKALPSVWALLDEMALIDKMSDPSGAGSLRSKEAVHSVKNILSASVPLLTWLPLPGEAVSWCKEQGYEAHGTISPEVKVLLLESAAALEKGEDGSKQLIQASMLLADEGTGRAKAFRQLGLALQKINRASHFFTSQLLPTLSPLHRDWVGAAHAFLRSAIAFIVVGITSELLQWDATIMMLSVAVMMSMYNTMDEPQKILSDVFVGQVLGAAAALVCLWVCWPLAQNTFQQVLWMAPFLFIGAILWDHKKCTIIGLDYSIALLLLLQPNHAWHEMSFLTSLLNVGMVVSAPIIGLLMFRYVFPLDSLHRATRALERMESDVVQIASHLDVPEAKLVLWQAKLSNRILDLTNWTQGKG
ncbi:MAG: FUSC family protein, partial [Saezia sp.]